MAHSLTLTPPPEEASRTRSPDGSDRGGGVLAGWPLLYIVPTRIGPTQSSELEEAIRNHDGLITSDAAVARIFVAKAGTRQRAEFELRCLGVETESAPLATKAPLPRKHHVEEKLARRPGKRRRLENKPVRSNNAPDEVINIDDSTTESESDRPGSAVKNVKPELANGTSEDQTSSKSGSLPWNSVDDQNRIWMVKLDWFRESLAEGKFNHLKDAIVYEGKRQSPKASQSKTVPLRPASQSETPRRKQPTLRPGEFREILERAKADARAASRGNASQYIRSLGPSRGRPSSHGALPFSSQQQSQTGKRAPQLVHQTTSEHDELVNGDVLDMPEWVAEGKMYACQRVTLPNPPNEPFLAELRKIKMARLLRGDEIGVRAYSTSIAALAAFPRPLKTTREVLALPGCDAKIAHLFREWRTNDGHIDEVDEIERDEQLQVLRVFYEIWGVGATTARELYDRGWRDLDDIIEYGWDTLSRVQQIGLKYYDDFQEKIPRQEVEFIAAKVVEHAKRVRDDGIECCIVGGYRRGKALSGDVDLILSHRDESQTLNLVRDVVISLEKEGWITHTLLLNLTSTKRDQKTLAFRPDGAGHGFDTLDKGLVVWQDIRYDQPGDGSSIKNPNIRRRVDIIISPWSTVGCAVVGWSGETTFQRDLRRYARKVKNWKFDSSGIRHRATGAVVDLEGVGGPSRTWLEAERKVFQGMGLAYREPWERCTG
ncbi:MAG: hypothetical protein M1823_005724 [Watsoniomyces obsoletus]|nr:MAG: hypothetical protein M1823_005724 [Watsoniomyces obsoletus]